MALLTVAGGNRKTIQGRVRACAHPCGPGLTIPLAEPVGQVKVRCSIRFIPDAACLP